MDSVFYRQLSSQGSLAVLRSQSIPSNPYSSCSINNRWTCDYRTMSFISLGLLMQFRNNFLAVLELFPKIYHWCSVYIFPWNAPSLPQAGFGLQDFHLHNTAVAMPCLAGLQYVEQGGGGVVLQSICHRPVPCLRLIMTRGTVWATERNPH